jgi:ABC-type lipoprotein release transport system permease subunit
MLKSLNFFHTAAENITRHRLRSLVVVLCLVAILFPFITAFSILEGVKDQAIVSVRKGADVYVTMDMFGRNGMIPQGMAEEIEGLEGVIKAVPRVIGRIYVKGRIAVILGIPLSRMKKAVSFIKGRLPEKNEVVVGKGLGEALGLDVGDNISLGIRVVAIIEHRPYIQRKVFRVSGIFDSETGIWTSDLVLVNIDDAASIYDMEDFVSDIAVYVEEGYTASVTEEIQKLNAYFRIQSKPLAEKYIQRGFNRKGGIFILLYAFALVLAVPVMLVVSGTGLSERRREIGVLKATGWQTSEVLQMVFFENMIIAFISAPAAFILAYIWIKLFNGFFIAQIFIAEIGSMPPFTVPAKFMPLSFVLSIFLALTLTMVGSIYSTWRTAVIPPVEALK